jgi:dolichol-phosphate mannosyltransferase
MPELSIVIPAHNEQENIGPCLDALLELLVEQERIDLEVIVVADGCNDGTEEAVQQRMERWPQVRLVRHPPPSGFGRAVRCGLSFVVGDVVIIYMADLSDSPDDALSYFRTIHEGYDCVFGSRFVRGAKISNYPLLKLVVNRIVNTAIQVMFWTRFNDLTNAFKAYRREVITSCGPHRSCHFNITLEMSLSALISGYRIKQIPIDWEGRTWGSTKLKLRTMGRRYLCTLMMLFFQRILISDDIREERSGAAADGIELLADSNRDDN